jgi:hypothetical protein
VKVEQANCSETSAIKHHTPDNNPKDYTRHSQNGENFKSRKQYNAVMVTTATSVVRLNYA